MTVGELIHELSKIDYDMEVKFYRMDWGYVDIKLVDVLRGFADLLTFSREEIKEKENARTNPT